MPETFIPFADSFDHGQGRPDLIDLPRAEAEQAARAESLSLRVLELPLTEGRILWTADHRRDRLNLVVEHGRVIRAAVF